MLLLCIFVETDGLPNQYFDLIKQKVVHMMTLNLLFFNQKLSKLFFEEKGLTRFLIVLIYFGCLSVDVLPWQQE